MATLAELSVADITTMQELVSHIVATLPKEPVLYDLGCGKNRMQGFQGVDFYADTDVRANLCDGEWKFVEDSSVDMFYSSHFIEHVPDLNTFMSRAWRKLKDGGLFLISTPYGFSVRAWQDPDHKRPIFRETYWYFNEESRKKMGVNHYEGCANFDIIDMWPVWNKDYVERAERNPALAEQFLKTLNAVDDLTVLLRARKG